MRAWRPGCAAAPRACAARRVGPEIQGIIDAVARHPAAICNTRYDVLATDPAYRNLFGVPEMAGTGMRNVLWTLFTVAEEACPVVHRTQELPIMVATLRGAHGRHTGEPARESFVERLSATGPYFAELWRGENVAPPGPRVKTFRHWVATDETRMTSVSLSVNGLPECWIVACTPADEKASEQVAALLRHREA